MFNKKLILVGSYPPPFGGVSVHISRLQDYLSENKINYLIYNHGKFNTKNVIPNNKSIVWYLKFLFKKNKNIIHFHQAFYGIEFLYWYLFSKINNKNIFITIHNDQIVHSKFKKNIAVFFLKRTNFLELLVVSNRVNKLLDKKKINNKYLPAYVPTKDVLQNNNWQNKNKTIVFAIFRVTKENFINIYGFDFVLRLLQKCDNEFNFKLLIGDKEKSDITYLKSLISKNIKLNNVEIIFEKHLTEILPTAHILLRPNKKDGYGLSLQEALEYGVIPLASDICERPKGTITFKTNSFDDFYEKFQKICSMTQSERKRYLDRKEVLNYHYELIRLYKKYLN